MNSRITIKYENAQFKLCKIQKNTKTSIEIYIGELKKMHLWKKSLKPTFANTSRPHEILPNNAIITGFCETIIINGKIRFTLIGNKNHLYWSMISLISSKASLNCWPTSHEMKSKANESKASKVKNINATP